MNDQQRLRPSDNPEGIGVASRPDPQPVGYASTIPQEGVAIPISSQHSAPPPSKEMVEMNREEEKIGQRKRSSPSGEGEGGAQDKGREGEDTRGRWTPEEHQRFLDALHKHGNLWAKVASSVGTRTTRQTRSHAQKYFRKLRVQALQKIRQDPSRANYIFVITREYRNRIPAPEHVIDLPAVLSPQSPPPAPLPPLPPLQLVSMPPPRPVQPQRRELPPIPYYPCSPLFSPIYGTVSPFSGSAITSAGSRMVFPSWHNLSTAPSLQPLQPFQSNQPSFNRSPP